MAGKEGGALNHRSSPHFNTPDTCGSCEAEQQLHPQSFVPCLGVTSPLLTGDSGQVFFSLDVNTRH